MGWGFYLYFMCVFLVTVFLWVFWRGGGGGGWVFCFVVFLYFVCGFLVIVLFFSLCTARGAFVWRDAELHTVQGAHHPLARPHQHAAAERPSLRLPRQLLRVRRERYVSPSQ